MIAKVKDNDLSAAMGEDIALVEFSAQWCGPCQMLAPVLEELSGEYGQRLPFYTVDTDENQFLSAVYFIQGVPTIVIMKHGTEADRMVGFLPKPHIKSWIDSHLG